MRKIIILLCLFIPGLTSLYAQVVNKNELSPYTGYNYNQIKTDTIFDTLFNYKAPNFKVNKNESFKDTKPPKHDKKTKDSKSGFLKSALIGSVSATSPYTHIPITCTILKNANIALGEIPISSGVGPSGAVTYNIPIAVYPGRQGLQPGISIAYNSQIGNGLMGQGWNISGLSAITLGNKSYHYDGQVEGAKTNKDNPCFLDGVRLIKISESGSQILYEADMGNTKVVAYHNGTNISYFKVLQPNGTELIYTFDYNSNGNLTYPLSKVTNLNGNYMDYTYGNYNGIYNINRIDYGATGQSAHFASVVFTYQDRNDKNSSYYYGKKLIQDKLLSKIECSGNGTIQQVYDFLYTTTASSSTSFLSQVNCSVNGKPFNPLKFFYGTDNNTDNYTPSETQLTSYFNSTIPIRIVNGKIDTYNNSDGLVVLPDKQPYVINRSWHSQLFGGHYDYTITSGYSNTQDILLYTDLNDSYSIPSTVTTGDGFRDILTADVDNQKGDEVVKINTYQQNGNEQVAFKIYKPNTYSGFYQSNQVIFQLPTFFYSHDYANLYPRLYLSGDFNGDGITEIVGVNFKTPIPDKPDFSTPKCYIFDLKNSTKSEFTFNYNPGEILIPGDYDGDGKTDLYHITNNGCTVYSFKSNPNSSQPWKFDLVPIAFLGNISPNSSLVFTDINGDGKTDILVPPSASYYNSCYYYDENCPYYDPNYGYGDPWYNPFTDQSNPYYIPECDPNSWNYDPYYTCPSLEHQHYIDNGSAWTVYLAKGNEYLNLRDGGNFETTHLNIARNSSGDKYSFDDINGDGRVDLLTKTAGGAIYVTYNDNGQFDPNGAKYYGYTSAPKVFVADVAGNNALRDIVSVYNATIKKSVSTRDNGLESLLTGTIDSYGKISVVQYGNIADQNHYPYYEEGYGAIFPYENYTGPLWVAKQMDVFHNSMNVASQSFSYTNAVVHKQGIGFCGFEKFKTNNNLEYDFSETTNEPYRFSVPSIIENPVSKTQNYFSVETSPTTKKTTIRLSSNVITDKLNNNTATSDFTYDGYGNQLSSYTNAGNGIYTSVVNQYYNYDDALNSSPYLIGLPWQNVTTKIRNGQSIANKQEIQYDANYRVVNKKSFINNNQTSELNYTYDAYNNIFSESVKKFTSSNTLTTNYTYKLDGRQLATKTDPLGFVTTYPEYDPVTGLLTRVTDHKNRSTTYSYDEQGHINTTGFADGTSKQIVYNWSNTGDNDIIYSITTTSTGDPSSNAFYDAFNHEVRKEITGFNGTTVATVKEYDISGNLKRQSDPFTGTAPANWTTNSYDNYNRLVSVTSSTGKTLSNTYNPNSITTTVNGIATTKNFDVTGSVLSVNDPAGTISYTLNAAGQPTSIQSPDGKSTTTAYDTYGRQTSLTDPSAGQITYAYDSEGNLSSQTDARGLTTSMLYDNFGRATSKTTPEFTTSYGYNADGLIYSISATNNTSRVISYDTYDRPESETETAGGKSFTREYIYNTTTGKKDALNYKINGAQTAKLSLLYNNFGYHNETKLNDATTIWKLTNVNDFGQPTTEELGDGLYNVAHNFDSYGIPTGITYKQGNTILNDLQLSFDVQTGNLQQRTMTGNITETFVYDNLNRLTQYGRQGYAPTVVNYSNMGNITGKSDVGTFDYGHATNPYAITGVAPATGNPIPMRTQNIDYTSFNKPVTINENGYVATFTYNSDFERTQMTTTLNGQPYQTKTYFGEYETEENTNGTSKEMLYLGGDAYSAPVVYMKQNGGAWQLYYIVRDHQNSITGILDNTGQQIAIYSYDPWGRMRDPNTLAAYAVDQEPTLFLGRGYTGHEHLPLFGLINMNGRLYDPCLGRFLNADNYVQEPESSQNLNRYNYCLNNPLVYTDPDGEIFWFIPIIIGAALFGTGNLVAHAIKGDIHNLGDGLKYFSQGALVGAALGAAWQFAPLIPWAGPAIRAGMNIYGYTQLVGTAVSTISGLGQGLFTGDWNALGNAGKIFLGNFNLDENQSFFGCVWQGISRHSWEILQTGIGYSYTQLRNTFGAVDRVDYLGGATFSIRENQDKRWGITIGNYININISDEIQGNFEDRVISDPLFMHEYGHTIDSRTYGLSYLFAIGLPSLFSAAGAKQVYGEPSGVTTHDFRWYEMRANQNAARYFGKYYGVNWLSLYRSGTIETYYPRKKR